MKCCAGAEVMCAVWQLRGILLPFDAIMTNVSLRVSSTNNFRPQTKCDNEHIDQRVFCV